MSIVKLEDQMASDAQTRYWKTMVHLQVHVYYLQTHLLRYQRIERRIECFLAVAASASIGGWAVWSQLWLVWAFVIAASQVLNAIRHLLPYSKRIELLQGILPELGQLLLDVEKEYYPVSEGALSDQAIHEMAIRFRAQKGRLTDKLDSCAFGDSKKSLASAELKAATYFREMYGAEEV